MKAVLLSPSKPSGWKLFIVLFCALLLCLGVLFEYQSLSGLLKLNIPYLAYFEYAVLVLISLIVSGFLLYIVRFRQYKKLNLIKFSVSSMTDGAYHFVAAPLEMKSADFLKYFFNYLSTKVAKEKLQAVLKSYYPYLEVRRSNELVEVAREMTLADAGIKNGDICQLRGKPKKVNV